MVETDTAAAKSGETNLSGCRLGSFQIQPPVQAETVVSEGDKVRHGKNAVPAREYPQNVVIADNQDVRVQDHRAVEMKNKEPIRGLVP